MSFRPCKKARTRAIRPVVDGLETRELLSTAMAPHADVTAHRTKHLPVITQFAKAKGKGVSTVPANGDVNPYGVAFVPASFPGGGVLNPGDVLVSNFNNSKNLQGTGTTIVRVTPTNQVS